MSRGRWLALLGLSAALSACGGSSSETPFPLEPDLARLGDGGPPTGARYVVFTGKPRADAGTGSGDEGEGERESPREE